MPRVLQSKQCSSLIIWFNGRTRAYQWRSKLFSLSVCLSGCLTAGFNLLFLFTKICFSNTTEWETTPSYVYAMIDKNYVSQFLIQRKVKINQEYLGLNWIDFVVVGISYTCKNNYGNVKTKQKQIKKLRADEAFSVECMHFSVAK